MYAELEDIIYAAASGIVVWADDRKRSDLTPSKLGNHVIIEHEDDYVTWYGHLSSYSVIQGQKVLQGDCIGRAGVTGNSTGPHLHFVIQHLGKGEQGFVISDVVDPAMFLGI